MEALHFVLPINFEINDEENYNFVECGVADGMSAFYLISSLSEQAKNIYLYDAMVENGKK